MCGGVDPSLLDLSVVALLGGKHSTRGFIGGAERDERIGVILPWGKFFCKGHFLHGAVGLGEGDTPERGLVTELVLPSCERL